MSYIRDARNKYEEDFSNTGEKKPNPYYEGYLNQTDKKYLSGFDWAAVSAENFFANIESYADDLPDDIDFDFNKINSNIILSATEPTAEELAKQSKETQLMYWFMNSILAHIESDRDELVTSMLENMDDEEYQKNYDDFWKNNI